MVYLSTIMWHDLFCARQNLIIIYWVYVVVVPTMIYSISVPTGKLTPIEPAEPSSPAPVAVRSSGAAPAPVSEYTDQNPEPPPLDPSYVPIKYDFIQYLKPTSVVYVPVRIKYPTTTNYYHHSYHHLGQPEHLNEIDDNNNIGHHYDKYSSDKAGYYDVKYDKYYGGKVPIKLLQKYANYPSHLQKKYIHYHLNNNSGR